VPRSAPLPVNFVSVVSRRRKSCIERSSCVGKSAFGIRREDGKESGHYCRSLNVASRTDFKFQHSVREADALQVFHFGNLPFPTKAEVPSARRKIGHRKPAQRRVFSSDPAPSGDQLIGDELCLSLQGNHIRSRRHENGLAAPRGRSARVALHAGTIAHQCEVRALAAHVAFVALGLCFRATLGFGRRCRGCS
jgi:hypothetical protein